MTRDKFYPWFIAGIICFVLGFVCFPFFIIGIVLIIIAFYNRKHEKCPKCGHIGEFEIISDEIINTKVQKYRSIEHRYSEGIMIVPDIIPSSVMESRQYVPTTDSWTGPHEYVGTVKTKQYNYERCKCTTNKIRIMDSDKIIDTHKIIRKCKKCGHMQQATRELGRVVNNLPDYAMKTRDHIDDVVLEYMKKGYRFNSNLPELDGLSYEEALELRNKVNGLV